MFKYDQNKRGEKRKVLTSVPPGYVKPHSITPHVPFVCDYLLYLKCVSCSCRKLIQRSTVAILDEHISHQPQQEDPTASSMHISTVFTLSEETPAFKTQPQLSDE